MNPGLGHDQDEWLMVQVAQGRPEMIEPLVRRYGTPLLTFIRHMVRDQQRSEDIFQDVFLSVWSNRSRYRFPLPFKPWLYRIAINRVRQVFRKHALPTQSLVDDDEPTPRPAARQRSPAESAIATETAAIVQNAVALLPVRQRMVVMLRMWNGMSYGEIAEALGVREGTVRSNMHDALITMRRHLQPSM